MGAGVAATVYSGSLFALLHSCKQEASLNVNWQPETLSRSHVYAIEKVLDVILPKTETPGAVELGIPRFISKYVTQVLSVEDQEAMIEVADRFVTQFETNSGTSLGKATQEDFETMIKKNFEGEDNRDDGFEFLDRVRGLGIWAWENSARVAKEHMWYEPVPARYVGCRPLDAEGDGKRMAL